MEKYNIINYTDVWGNPTDGWEVNDVKHFKQVCHINDDDTDKQILEKLVSIGYLATSDMRRIALEDFGSDIEIYQVKGHRPLGILTPQY